MRPLGSTFSAYLEACASERSLSQHSLRAYRQDLKEFDDYSILFDIQWDQATCQNLVAYRCHLRDVRAHSPATVRRRLVTLKAFYKWVSKKSLCVDPFVDLDLEIKVPPRLPRPVDRATLRSVLRCTRGASPIAPDLVRNSGSPVLSQDQVTGLAVRILIATGIRIGELVRLSLKDISGGGTRLRIIGKGNRERIVYLANEALVSDVNHVWKAAIADRGSDGAFLLNVRGTPLTEATFRKRLHRTAADLAVCEPLTPHRFCHSAATLLI